MAERAGLTRQSVSAIESGRATPSVDVALRLARALDSQVEDLFGAPDGAPPLEIELASDPAASRIALALIRERWIGLPLGREGLRTAADALVVKPRGRRATVAPLRALAEARDTLVVMGCATGLGVLADRLSGQRAGGRVLWVPASSGAALQGLANGHTHVAGVHWLGRDGNADANVDMVRRTAREALVVITLARWEAGLLTRPEDQRVRSVADVGAPGVRLAVREKGSGARHLLEQQLRATGLSLDVTRGASITALGHLDVARAISLGAADVGVATRDVALTFGLRFLPLAEERYDLVVPKARLSDPRVERLLDGLVSQATRRELDALGYDVSKAGTRIAEVRAA